MIDRRQLVKWGAACLSAPAISTFMSVRAWSIENPSILGAVHVDYVYQIDDDATDFSISYNKRATAVPQLRALVKTPGAISFLIDWARTAEIPFAVRSGGHCFAGFSQSVSFVIDTRLMNDVVLPPSGRLVDVGAGATISDVYRGLAPTGHTLPTGFCQQVGMGGHVLGGGIGYLTRRYGLTCDRLLAADVVLANGDIVTCSERAHPDLFWALRGGCGGSFGIVTNFTLRPVDVAEVITFGIDWIVKTQPAAQFMMFWQQWCVTAPREISATLNITKRSDDQVLIRLEGQSTGDSGQVAGEVKRLLGAAQAWSAPRGGHRSFLDAANHFWPNTDAKLSADIRIKSDIITSPLPAYAYEALFDALLNHSPGSVTLLCDAMGGALRDFDDHETAFPHRQTALFKLQYNMQARTPEQWPARSAALDAVYAVLRPFMSGAVYGNYPDLELADWAQAYWQDNVGRLRDVKRQYDPDNIFHHAQTLLPA
jgi:FAD/FMN-containing dehydrogenase